jgi:hypothetical protein
MLSSTMDSIIFLYLGRALLGHSTTWTWHIEVHHLNKFEITLTLNFSAYYYQGISTPPGDSTRLTLFLVQVPVHVHDMNINMTIAMTMTMTMIMIMIISWSFSFSCNMNINVNMSMHVHIHMHWHTGMNQDILERQIFYIGTLRLG